MPIKIIFQGEITREIVRRNKNKIYLFGYNLEREGYGGQAAAMRGELNAIGIPTKKKPDMNESSFFTDDEFEDNKDAIDAAVARIPKDATVIIPMAGLGTGRAQLKERAPKTFEYLNKKIRDLQR